MEKIKELEIKLDSLKKQFDKEEKFVNKKLKEIENNPEIKKLQTKIDKLKLEKNIIEKIKEKAERKIKEQFLIINEHNMWNFPRFQHKTMEWDEETNIYDDVLSEISKHSPLYLLRNQDIENAVESLIKKAINESPELNKFITKYQELNKKISKLNDEKYDLKRKLMNSFDSKLYDLRQEISEIEKNLKDPKKYLEQEKRKSKRDKAREKLKDPKIIDEIYNELDIKLPKIQKTLNGD